MIARPALTLFLASLAAAPLLGQSLERASMKVSGRETLAESSYPSISDDGRFVAFLSKDHILTQFGYDSWMNVFVHDRLTGTTIRADVSSAGVAADGTAFDAAISGDGRFVAFTSTADNLVPSTISVPKSVFVHDRLTGTTTRESIGTSGAEPNSWSWEADISFDGRFVVFESWADTLVPGDTNHTADVFLRDRLLGTTERVSVSSAGAQATGASTEPCVSSDGRFVVFTSAAADLVPGDTNGADDVFVHDRQTGLTTRVSVDSLGAQGNGTCQIPSISADGRWVGFSSIASNLVPGDVNGAEDVFVHDRLTGATERLSQNALGVGGNGASMKPTISNDGRFVSFQSIATNLVAGYHVPPYFAVYLADRQTGALRLLSESAAGVPGNSTSFRAQIAGGGRHVAFASHASNLIRGDVNDQEDIYVVHPGDAVVHLALDGACPAPVSLTVWNATGDGAVGLLAGAAGGSFVKPGPPCQGAVLGIGRPVAMRLLHADSGGRVEVAVPAGVALCGASVQVVDLGNCTVSLALPL